MTLKRLANIFAATAGTVLVAGGAMFMIVTWRHSNEQPTEDRILNVSLLRESAGSDRLSYYVLEINKSGDFVVNNEILDDNELLEKLKTLARVQEDAPFRLRVAGETNWESIVHAVDLLESAGLTNIKFDTRTRSSE